MAYGFYGLYEFNPKEKISKIRIIRRQNKNKKQ